MGFGGIHRVGNNYRVGYKYESRSLNIYNNKHQDGNFYYYDKGSNLFTSGKTQGSIAEKKSDEQSIAVGHSFSWNDQEILSDSRFTEVESTNSSYSFYQTFGYKLNFLNTMQYMAGFAHRFGSDSTDLSESNYYSTGFSWLTNTLRSTISVYYSKQNNNQDTQSAGISFGSEFSY